MSGCTGATTKGHPVNAWFRGRRPDGQLRTPLVAALAALLLGLVPHVMHFPVWVSALAIICAGYRLWAEERRGRLPAPALRIFVVVGAFIWVVAEFQGINGIVPGSALLAVMAGLKLLETTGKRDLHIIVMVAAFLMLAGTLRTQSIVMLPYLVIAAPALIIAWLAVARSGKALPLRSLLSHAKFIVLPAIPLVAVLFILFPRVQGAFWALPADGAAVTGLSDSLTPGDISRLVSSNEIAFRVEFDAEPPDARLLYWRGPVLEFFRDRTWQQGAIGHFSEKPPASTTQTAPVTRYRIVQQPTGQRWVFGLEITEPDVGSAIRTSKGGTLLRFKPIKRLLSAALTARTDALRTEQLSDRRRDYLTAFDPNANQRAQALSQNLRAGTASTNDFVTAALALFRDNDFAYTLEPPPLGRNSIDEFIFDSKRGFCAHYASAFAFLMRAGGVPARVVVGYQGGATNPLTGQHVVRQSDAHAWVEILNDANEWQRVDPTAEVAALRIFSGLDAALEATGERRSLFSWDIPLAERMQLAWDALNARWDEWILGYGPDTQRAFLNWLGLGEMDWRKLALWLTGCTLAAMLFVTFLVSRRYKRPPPDKTERRYRQLTQLCATPVRPSASPMHIKTLLGRQFPARATEIDAVIEQYQALRFADIGAYSAFDASCRALIAALRREPATITKHQE